MFHIYWIFVRAFIFFNKKVSFFIILSSYFALANGESTTAHCIVAFSSFHGNSRDYSLAIFAVWIENYLGVILLPHIQNISLKVFFEKGALKICYKFTGEHPCRKGILLCKFIGITFRHGCSLVNLPHIFRTPIYKSTYGGLLLKYN